MQRTQGVLLLVPEMRVRRQQDSSSSRSRERLLTLQNVLGSSRIPSVVCPTGWSPAALGINQASKAVRQKVSLEPLPSPPLQRAGHYYFYCSDSPLTALRWSGREEKFIRDFTFTLNGSREGSKESHDSLCMLLMPQQSTCINLYRVSSKRKELLGSVCRPKSHSAFFPASLFMYLFDHIYTVWGSEPVACSPPSSLRLLVKGGGGKSQAKLAETDLRPLPSTNQRPDQAEQRVTTTPSMADLVARNDCVASSTLLRFLISKEALPCDYGAFIP